MTVRDSILPIDDLPGPGPTFSRAFLRPRDFPEIGLILLGALGAVGAATAGWGLLVLAWAMLVPSP